MGPLQVSDQTRNELVAHANQTGPLDRDTDAAQASFAKRVGEMLQMIAASSEYQFT